ncbi:hypothetical protein C8Q76DRAFT_802448 [Earliella scabrosa]|nr:hypothetical protein C8Q76DRAFT_802448 [Earliella scabrosa]
MEQKQLGIRSRASSCAGSPQPALKEGGLFTVQNDDDDDSTEDGPVVRSASCPALEYAGSGFRFVADAGETNFDAAFAFPRAVIQGGADMGTRLSEDEVQSALEFGVHLFNPTIPEYTLRVPVLHQDDRRAAPVMDSTHLNHILLLQLPTPTTAPQFPRFHHPCISIPEVGAGPVEQT